MLPHAEEVLAKSVLFNLRIGNVFAWLRLTVEPRAPAPLAFSISVFSSLVPAPDFCAATLVPSYSFAPTSNTSRAQLSILSIYSKFISKYRLHSSLCHFYRRSQLIVKLSLHFTSESNFCDTFEQKSCAKVLYHCCSISRD